MAICTDRKFETDQIARRLSAMKPGEVVSFAELSKIAGMEITSSASALKSGRRIALNDARIVTESVRGVGLRRVPDEEIATSHSDRDVASSRRQAKRSLKKLACVEDFNAITNHAQLSHVIKSSFFGAVAFMARKGKLQEIARAAAGRSSELPVKETLRAFIGEEKV
jgi:hypothetical protein